LILGNPAQRRNALNTRYLRSLFLAVGGGNDSDNRCDRAQAHVRPGWWSYGRATGAGRRWADWSQQVIQRNQRQRPL